MIVDIQEFADLADSIVNEEIPDKLLTDLNLGISVVPDVHEENEYYIMGEYISDEMGSRVLLYYGSFAEVLQGESRLDWIEEIKDTILHELQHHIESLAGDESLARLEEEEME